MSKPPWFDVLLVDEFAQQRVREAFMVAYPAFHQVDTSAYAMTAIESNRRCGKTEAQGVAIEAQRRLEGRVPAPDAFVPTERQTYRIQAREVVPGMEYSWDDSGDAQTWRVATASRPWAPGRWRLDHETGSSGRGSDDIVVVRLPGVSPRELACTCEACEPERGPGHHAEECPVAPVPGRHGGLRLWPAPFRGMAWTWNRHSLVWFVPHGPSVSAHCLLDDLPAGLVAPAMADVLWQCFYLPPVQKPERRPALAWDPYGTDLDLAVRYG